MRTAIALLTGCIVLLTLSTAVSARSPFGWLRGLAHRVLALEKRVDGLEDEVDNAATKGEVIDLEERVDGLEVDVDNAATKGEVMDLESSIDALAGRVDALEQATNGLAVYDAMGEKVGDVVGTSNSQPLVVVRSGEYPFVIQVGRDGFTGMGTARGGPFYEDKTCVTPFITILDSPFPSVTFGAPGQRTAYIIDSTTDSTEEPTVIINPFILEQDGSCDPEGRSQVTAFQATFIVDLEKFTPRFSVR